MKQSHINVQVMAIVLFLALSVNGYAADVSKLTTEELKIKMDQGGVIVLDVKKDSDWSSAEFKIKGAHRTAPKEYATWSTRYSKDDTLVLYCA